MSRCFPFPPPGYDYEPRPARSEERHKDLLRKVKHKDKKHGKEKDRIKEETKEKDRDHRKHKHNKKHKRAKCGERKKNKDIDKDSKQTLRHRKPEENGQHNIIPADEFTRIFGQGDHTDHRYNNTELLTWSTDTIGCTGSKEKDRNLLGRMVKKSAQTTEGNYRMVQKSDNSIAHANKKGMGRGINSKTEIKNGKSLQDRSAEMHSRRRYTCNGVGVCHDNSDKQRSCEGVHTATGRVTPNPNSSQRTEETGQGPEISVHSANVKNDRSSTKGMEEENQSANDFRRKMDQQFARNKDGAVEGKAKGNCRKGLEGKDRDSVVKKRKTECKNKEKEMEKNGTVNEQKHEDLGVDNLVCLGSLNEQKIASDIRKRKDFDHNSSPHEHSIRTGKLPMISLSNLVKMSQHPQWITSHSSTELIGLKTCDIGQHECQHSYNNGITGSRYSEEQIPSVSSSGYESSKGYLKQPHPDTNYLSQVHCIPSTHDFSEYIDQDWLFSMDHVRRETVTLEAVESRQVWSAPQLIHTADVIAMPYVVPL